MLIDNNWQFVYNVFKTRGFLMEFLVEPVLNLFNGTSVSNFIFEMDKDVKGSTLAKTALVALASGIVLAPTGFPVAAACITGVYAFSCMTGNYNAINNAFGDIRRYSFDRTSAGQFDPSLYY